MLAGGDAEHREGGEGGRCYPCNMYETDGDVALGRGRYYVRFPIDEVTDRRRNYGSHAASSRGEDQSGAKR